MKMKQKIDTEQVIRGALESMIEGSDFFIVGVELKGHTGAEKLTVLVDGENGVGIETCSEISRKLAAFVEEENVLGGAYTLEVSSPGIDHPLSDVRQYKKNIGRTLKVKTTAQETLTGTLRDVHEHSILLEVPQGSKKQPGEVLLPYDEIELATVEVAFK
jgi:ribosome maturation factor RimP